MTNHLAELTLHEYLDGALDAAATQAVVEHLSWCPSCQEQLAEIQRLFAILDGLPEAPLTVDLVPRVMSALRPPAKPFLPGWWRWIAVGEGVAAAVLTLLLLPTIRTLVGEWSFTLPTAEIANQLLLLWAEIQPTMSISWPGNPLNITVPLIVWAAILGLGILMGLIGNSLLLLPLLRSLSHPPHRGQHA